MNERLSLQDLIDLLAKKQEITKKDAEAFLRELVAVVTENIEAGESVKIKDLGTFKTVKINARKSVDVNTGEAIEIAAHYKLSFNPDKLLKEAVNRPFAHFESVVLEEGVTFDNMESEIEEERDEEDEEDVTIEDEITGYKTIELTDNIDNKTDNDIQPVEIINTDISEEEVVEELVGEAVEPEPVKEEVISEPEVEIEDKTELDPENEDFAREDIVPKRKGIRKRYITLAFFIFLIIAGFVVGGLYFQEIATYLTKGASNDEDTMKIAKLSDIEPPLVAPVIDSITKEPDSIPASPASGVHSQDRGKDLQAPPSSAPVKPAKAIAPKVSVDNPLAEETIKYGHTLRNIALKYYGNKSFWVYIYEENKDKIKNINNVPIGTKLTIPAPVKYKINPQDEESVKKAKAIENILFEKAAKGSAK
jgi:nucleoid DNA-binding protein